MIKKEIYDILDEIGFYSFRDSLLIELEIELGLNPNQIRELKFSQFNLNRSLFFLGNKNFQIPIRLRYKLKQLFDKRINGYIFQIKGNPIELHKIHMINTGYIKKFEIIKRYLTNYSIVSDNKANLEVKRLDPNSFECGNPFGEMIKKREQSDTKFELFLQLLESIESKTKSKIYSLTTKEIKRKFLEFNNLYISVFEIVIIIKHINKERNITISQNPKHNRYIFQNKKYPGITPGKICN